MFAPNPCPTRGRLLSIYLRPHRLREVRVPFVSGTDSTFRFPASTGWDRQAVSNPFEGSDEAAPGRSSPMSLREHAGDWQQSCFPILTVIGWMPTRNRKSIPLYLVYESLQRRFRTISPGCPQVLPSWPFPYEEDSAMRLVDEGSTSPDAAAARSRTGKTIRPGSPSGDGTIRCSRRWCRGYGLDEDSVDEVCQRIWIELADRMRTFRYDPNGSFRGWLRQVCVSRARSISCGNGKPLGLLSLDDRDQRSRGRRAAKDATRDRSRRGRPTTCSGSSCSTRPRRPRPR